MGMPSRKAPPVATPCLCGWTSVSEGYVTMVQADGRRRLGLSRSGAHLEEAVGLAELGGLRDVGDVGLRERVGEGGHACVRVYGRVGVAIGE